MQYINPYGKEVNIPAEVWARLRHDRPFEARKYVRADLGKCTQGPEDRILLLLFENGIGDVIHSMPAIRSKIESGFRVSVGCNPHHADIYRRLGCEVIEEMEPSIDMLQKYGNEYGTVHSLRHWCRTHDEESDGNVTVPRFQQFADYIKVALPETFDWRPYLLGGKKTSPASDLVLGLDSTSAQRGYPHHQALYDELVARHYTVRAMGLPGKGASYTESLPTDDLLRAVDGARSVVAVDAGILAIALALGKPVVALMGPTSDDIIIGQFSRYRSMEDVIVLRSTLSDTRCARPCNFSGNRGFDVGGKCHNQADCMREIAIHTILSTLEQLWQKIRRSRPLNKSTKRPRTKKSSLRRVTLQTSISAKESTKSEPVEKLDSKLNLPVITSNP